MNNALWLVVAVFAQSFRISAEILEGLALLTLTFEFSYFSLLPWRNLKIDYILRLGEQLYACKSRLMTYSGYAPYFIDQSY